MSETTDIGSNRPNMLGRILGPGWWLFLPWLTLVGGYAIASLAVPPGPSLTAFGDIVQCLVPWFAITGLLLNAGSRHWRENAFWLLMALGCAMWMGAQFLWTYIEVIQQRAIPNPFDGDVIYFIHAVPMIAALTLLPHTEGKEHKARIGYLDFSLLLLWWIYLYLFVVAPWQFIAPNPAVYGVSYTRLADVEYLVLAAGLGVLAFHARNDWRRIYAHLFGAALLYFIGAHVIDVAIDRNEYFTGSTYDLPLVASFVWMGTAGALAHRLSPLNRQASTPGENPWPERGVIAAVISMPLLALWTLRSSSQPESVRHFRLVITCVTVIVAVLLVFVRQRLLDRDRLNLLRSLQASIENLKRLQEQMVQREKLVSLGQLAAGAAHEINNPLTGILGYAELLSSRSAADKEQQIHAEKILQLARRIKGLVSNLLGLARQQAIEKKDLDLNDVLKSALELCELQLQGKKIRIETELASALPPVRGNASHLLQVFHNIIRNAVDAMDEKGGGVLRIRTSTRDAAVRVDFSDTGPGIQQPDRVFDPFYTTKPIGGGTGLGLSVCYAIVDDHGGHISCQNLPEGGALFRVELPVALFSLAKPAVNS